MAKIIGEWVVSNWMGFSEEGMRIIPAGAGGATIIEGSTGEGKTSLLYGLMMAVGGKAPQEFLVHDGNGEAALFVQLDDLDGAEPATIKRRVEGDTTKGKVLIKGLDTTGGEQKALNALIGGYINVDDVLSDDPARLEKSVLRSFPMVLTEAQYLTLTGGRKLSVSLEGHPLEVLPRLEKLLFDERTDLNTRAKNLRAVETSAAAQLHGFDSEAARQLDTLALSSKLREAQAHNDQLARLLAQTERRADRITDLREQLEALEAEQAAEQEQFLALGDPADTSALEAQLSGITEQTRLLAKYDEGARAAQEAAGLEAQSTTLKTQIEAIRHKPTELLAAVDLPIEGLTVVDGHLAYKGRPLKSMSGGERIIFAVQLQAVLAGELRTLYIDGMERLSKTAEEKALVEARKHNLQVIGTRVTEGKLHLRIVEADGSVQIIGEEEEAEAEAIAATA